MIQVGDEAPDVKLKTVADRPVCLSQIWQHGHHALVIFLRHLA